MHLLTPFAPTTPTSNSNSSTIADLFTKPLSRHRFDTLIGIGDIPNTTTPSVVPATVGPVVAPTVVASATAPTASNSVPILPIVLDTGASFSIIPFALDFTSAPYGLIQPSASVVSNSKVASNTASKAASIALNDPYTLITGEDVSVDPVDLSSTDSDSVEFELASTFDSFEFQEFGTATLIFISGPNLDLINILVKPNLGRFDWLHWIPLPRLILPESYFHIYGLDYLQAFALFHLIPIWIYYLLHFGLE